jgi:membrane protein
LKKELKESLLLRNFAHYWVRLNFGGLRLYDLMELYIIGIVEGAVSNRAGSIAFSFMALFPLLYLFLILSHTFLSKAFNKTS